MTYPVAMNILNQRIKSQTTIFHYQEPGLSEKWMISGLQQELNKMNPEQLFMSESKEVVKD